MAGPRTSPATAPARSGLTGDAADETVVGRVPFLAAPHHGPPFGQRHQAGFEHFPVAEPGEDLVVVAPAAGAQLLVEQLLHFGGPRRVGRVLRARHPGSPAART